MALRRPVSTDDELPPLPPMDGEGDEPTGLPDDTELPWEEESSALDDGPADDLEVDEPAALYDPAPDGADPHGTSDDTEGPDEALDDADEIDADDGARWTLTDVTDDMPGDEDLDTTAPEVLTDHGEEGPEHDALDDVDPLPPLDEDTSDDTVDDVDGGDPTLLDGLPEVFRLPAAPAVTVRRLPGDGLTLHAALGEGRLLVAGEALWSLALYAVDDPDAALAPLDSPDDALFSVVAEDTAGCLCLGTLTGEIHRHDRDGVWKRVVASGRRAPHGAVTAMAAVDHGMWACTREGALWHGVRGRWRAVPDASGAVQTVAHDGHGTVLVTVRTRTGGVLRQSADAGQTWSDTVLPGADAPWLLAANGDLRVVAPGTGPGVGHVSVDGGRHWVAWAVLDGATAVALAETDDGAAQVVWSVHHEADDRAVVLSAGVNGEGGPVDPRRLAWVEPQDDRAGAIDMDEGPVCRVESLVSLDRAGRRIAVVAARGVLLVRREG